LTVENSPGNLPIMQPPAPDHRKVTGASGRHAGHDAVLAAIMAEREAVQTAQARFERERLAERKQMQQRHNEWLARNEQTQIDVRAYAAEIGRLKAALTDIVADRRPTIVDDFPDLEAADARTPRQQLIIVATRQYCSDLKATVDRSIVSVDRLRQEAQRHHENHNRALDAFDEQYAAHIEDFEVRIDRLALAIAAASWERRQPSD
jgi:hypothetical protein